MTAAMTETPIDIIAAVHLADAVVLTLVSTSSVLKATSSLERRPCSSAVKSTLNFDTTPRTESSFPSSLPIERCMSPVFSSIIC